jgi:hypothetical protein
MVRINIKSVAVLFFSLGLTGLRAQESITVTGSNATGISGAVSYTVGQVFYETNTGTGGSAAQGVQQPYEIYVVTGLETSSDINLIFTAYPNPTPGILTLKIENYIKKNMSYHLYTLEGKLLENKNIVGTETIITMNDLIPGPYLLKIYDKKKEMKIFKIVKY